jgi:hypothetical protein
MFNPGGDGRLLLSFLQENKMMEKEIAHDNKRKALRDIL